MTREREGEVEGYSCPRSCSTLLVCVCRKRRREGKRPSDLSCTLYTDTLKERPGSTSTTKRKVKEVFKETIKVLPGGGESHRSFLGEGGRNVGEG